jgi:hypothetical protein
MEISSNALRPYGYDPAQQNAGRSEKATPFNKGEVAEQDNNETTAEYLPLKKSEQRVAEPSLDYRQLILQARYQQAGAQQGEVPQREAYRISTEPLHIQRALGAYRGNTELQDGSGELMPRLDNYV